MRLCAFLEAWVQLICRREPGRASKRIPQKGVTELIKHHKVAAASSQPWRRGPIVRLAARRDCDMTDTIRPLIAGNWKMNGLKASATEFEAMLAAAPDIAAKADLLVCPPATLI